LGHPCPWPKEPCFYTVARVSGLVSTLKSLLRARERNTLYSWPDSGGDRPLDEPCRDVAVPAAAAELPAPGKSSISVATLLSHHARPLYAYLCSAIINKPWHHHPSVITGSAVCRSALLAAACFVSSPAWQLAWHGLAKGRPARQQPGP